MCCHDDDDNDDELISVLYTGSELGKKKVNSRTKKIQLSAKILFYNTYLNR